MKQFLEDNKIYFEVVVSTLLAIMAIVVSLKANSIADTQTALAEEANRISMLEYIPEVTAEFRLVRSDSDSRTEHLVVENKGKPLYEFESYSIAFLSVRELELVNIEHPANNSYERVGMMVPIINYFPIVAYRPNNNSGEIFRQIIEDVNMLRDSIESFDQELRIQNKYTAATIERYIKVSYVDSQNKKYTQYFRFGVGGDGIPITEDEGKTAYSLHKQLTDSSHAIDYMNSTPEQMISLWDHYKKLI